MATLVDYVAYFACRLCFGIDYITSNVIAWAAGVAFGFVVNNVYVFRALDWSAKVAFRECWQFVAARLLSGVLETAILKIFVDWLGMDDAIVKIFSNIIVIVNYVLSKLVIFRKKKGPACQAGAGELAQHSPAKGQGGEPGTEDGRAPSSRKQRGGRTSGKNKLARG